MELTDEEIDEIRIVAIGLSFEEFRDWYRKNHLDN